MYDKTGKSYHKLIVWQRMMELLKLTYELTKLLHEDEKFGLTSQMRRAAVSVISNFVEGYAKESKQEKRHFLEISDTSLLELEAQSEICLELGYWIETDFERFDKKRAEVSFLLRRYRQSIV